MLTDSPVKPARGRGYPAFDRIDPAARQRLHEAILRRARPLVGIHTEFNLARYDIGIYSFFRYARRLRQLETLTEIAVALQPETRAILSHIPNLAAMRLLEVITTPEAPTRALAEAAYAFRTIVRAAAEFEDVAPAVAFPELTPPARALIDRFLAPHGLSVQEFLEVADAELDAADAKSREDLRAATTPTLDDEDAEYDDDEEDEDDEDDEDDEKSDEVDP